MKHQTFFSKLFFSSLSKTSFLRVRVHQKADLVLCPRTDPKPESKKAEAAAATWYSSTPVLQYKPKREERQKQVTRRNNHESQSLCQEDVRTLPSGTQGEENIHHVQEKPKGKKKTWTCCSAEHSVKKETILQRLHS